VFTKALFRASSIQLICATCSPHTCNVCRLSHEVISRDAYEPKFCVQFSHVIHFLPDSVQWNYARLLMRYWVNETYRTPTLLPPFKLIKAVVRLRKHQTLKTRGNGDKARHYMEMSCQLHAAAALPQEINLLVPI
jgi:hypothetical protein